MIKGTYQCWYIVHAHAERGNIIEESRNMRVLLVACRELVGDNNIFSGVF